MGNKKPVGMCDCGLCFNYEIISKLPLKIKCKKCGKEPIRKGMFSVNADEVTF